MNRKIKGYAVDICAICDAELVSGGGCFTVKIVSESSSPETILTGMCIHPRHFDNTTTLSPLGFDYNSLVLVVSQTLIKFNTYLYDHSFL